MHRQLTFIVLAVNSVVIPAGLAETIVVVAGRDSTLYESSTGSLANGGGAHLFVGRVGFSGAGAVRRGLLVFDVAGVIPQGATIRDVSLRLNASKVPGLVPVPRAVSLHRVTTDWSEGTAVAFPPEGRGAVSGAGDVTWIHTGFATQAWFSPGGDFVAAVDASLSVAGVGVYLWASTPQTVDTVQRWLDSPSDNFGWLLLGDESTTQTAKRFDSRENITAANRPALTVGFIRAGDCNADDRVDLVDFSRFQSCVDSAGTDVGCDCFDFDASGTFDLRDFAALQRSFTG